MNKLVFDMLFIVCAATIMVVMMKILSSNDYIAFSFMPVLIAFYIGQLSQRKFGKPNEGE